MAVGLAVMVLATYLTRIGGVWVMHFVPLTQAVRRMLAGMANTVLLAVVIPYAWEGDWGMRAGILAGIVCMATTRRTVFSMAAGVLVTALYRLAF